MNTVQKLMQSPVLWILGSILGRGRNSKTFEKQSFRPGWCGSVVERGPVH